MKNFISTRLPGIIAQAQVALPAVNRHSATLGLTHVTGMGERLTALIDAREKVVLAKADLAIERKTLNGLFETGKRHAGTARDALRFHLGSVPSLIWTMAGYEGSLAIPRALEPLLYLLQRLAEYLEAHPEHANAGMKVTAARTKQLVTQMRTAFTAVTTETARVRKLIQDRDAKALLVRKDLRALYAELKIALDPMSNLFEEFGFKRPGAVETPEAPAEVSVEIVGAATALVKVEPPARARRFRFWRKVVGVDDDFVLVETRRSPDLALETLPDNAEIHLAVSAVNRGGESARSAVIVLQTRGNGELLQSANSESETNHE